MVSVLNFGGSAPSSSSGEGHCVVFFARHSTLRVLLSTQVYKWVTANLQLGGNLAMA